MGNYRDNCVDMNTLVTSTRVLARHVSMTNIAKRGMGSPAPWNYLWKPGPHPETDDERRAAAKKYGMIYEDYKPSNEPDSMMGDYPQLPVEPAHEKKAETASSTVSFN